MMMINVAQRTDAGAGTRDFATFFAATFPRARATATRLAGSAIAEDLAIDALAKAYARWPAVRAMDYPEAWVMRVVTNAALDEIRRKKAVLPSFAIHDESTTLELREDVLGALRTLTRRQQEVVVLRYIVDLPEAEVARILAISTGSVKSHLHRALPRLREHLAHDRKERP
jgi:RNA polymerase sigma-70 factor (ECF subfamily)